MNLITIKDMCKIYNPGENEVRALDHVNLTIDRGEYVAIIGHSGSGKSTLMNMLGCLDIPTSGKYYLDNIDVSTMSDNDLSDIRNKEIGFIFQGFNLLAQRSVLRNVCYPLEIAGVGRKEARARAMELLHMVGLADRANSYPSQLSGGQKQRVAIARALATSPKYLLCDEATSALDPNTTRSILELLREINNSLGVTIVVITHEMKVIDQICDRVAVIDHSRIAEEGKVSEVFTNPKSQIARDLIIPKERTVLDTTGGRRLRLTFEGDYSNAPVISEMVLECQAPVNILFADTKEFEGVIHGQMIIELPKDQHQADKIIVWLRNSQIKWREEE